MLLAALNLVILTLLMTIDPFHVVNRDLIYKVTHNVLDTNNYFALNVPNVEFR